MTAFAARRLLPFLVCWAGAASAADDFLPPQQAFRFDARALDARSVEIAFTVADGYYLYREQFRFDAAGAGVTLGMAQIPAGKIQHDETFGKDLETHRGRLVIRLPVSQAPSAFELRVTSQGCADRGLCYSPMQSRAQVRLTGFGGDGTVRVSAAQSASGPAAGGGR